MKQRLITIAAGFIALIAAGVWVAQGAASYPPAVAGPETTTVPSPAASVVDDAATETAVRRPGGSSGLVSYAIPITELQGFPPDIAPGTTIDLWVMWQPPVRRREQVHRLLQDVVVEKIVPPLLPDGPHAAVLLVSSDDFGTLVWGDRLGALSAAVTAAPQG